MKFYLKNIEDHIIVDHIIVDHVYWILLSHENIVKPQNIVCHLFKNENEIFRYSVDFDIDTNGFFRRLPTGSIPEKCRLVVNYTCKVSEEEWLK